MLLGLRLPPVKPPNFRSILPSSLLVFTVCRFTPPAAPPGSLALALESYRRRRCELCICIRYVFTFSLLRLPHLWHTVGGRGEATAPTKVGNNIPRPPIHLLYRMIWPTARLFAIRTRYCCRESEVGQQRRAEMEVATEGGWMSGDEMEKRSTCNDRHHLPPEIYGLIYFWCGVPLMANIYPVYSVSIYIHPNLCAIICIPQRRFDGFALSLTVCWWPLVATRTDSWTKWTVFQTQPPHLLFQFRCRRSHRIQSGEC